MGEGSYPAREGLSKECSGCGISKCKALQREENVVLQGKENKFK